MIKILDDKEALKARAQLEREMKNAGEDKIIDFDYEEYKEKLREFYSCMEYVLNYYMDIPRETKNLVILWTIGTYFHSNFNTYPYLFLNAMRSSGKTRLLKIIETFCYKGQLTMSLTESVLFRTTGTLLLDEFEGVNRKGSENLKELLNSAYKKGTKVFRMKKSKTVEGESQVVEEFQPYRPIAIANIWGMEEVLGDRCINLSIEKSDDNSKTMLVEDFADLEVVKELKKTLEKLISVVSCSVVTAENIHSNWNEYVKEHLTTLLPHTTFNTYNYTKLHKNDIEAKKTEEMLKGKEIIEQDYNPLFDKIYNSKINGRHLELFFPLFILAGEIDSGLLDYTIDCASRIVFEKKEDETIESKDVMVYSIVAKQTPGVWYEVSGLTTLMRMGLGEGENEWLNSKWVGRALKRLKLTKQRTRTNTGISVMLDVEKAKQKEKMFK